MWPWLSGKQLSLSGHRGDQKFLHPLYDVTQSLLSFKALGFHLPISTVFREISRFICIQIKKRAAWYKGPMFFLQIKSADKIRLSLTDLNRPVPVEGFSLCTSISLSNMWASGRKEMRQSSWFGKITFCKTEKQWDGFLKKIKILLICCFVWGGGGSMSYLCHFKKSWEVGNHVPMSEHDSFWVSCVKICRSDILINNQEPQKKNMMGHY